MARIRTIKPEFFTSADIVELTPLSRLFYIALWCEADREGRLRWNTKTLKIRYLPMDDCDIDELSGELMSAGLISIYEVDGREYAEILSFSHHQVINNRESVSIIPPNPDASTTRESGVQGEGRKERKEGKGKEGALRGTRLSIETLPDEWEAFCREQRPDLHPHSVFSEFRDYWAGVAGQNGVKLDWLATWRNWVRRQNAPRVGSATQQKPAALKEL